LKKLLYIAVAYFTINASCFGQETDYGPGYQHILISNPAFSGADGEARLRLSYLNFYPGNQYGLHTFYSSCDSYFSELHGGAGIWLSDDYYGGIVNDLRGGLSYAYFLQAGKELFINAGLSASIFHRGFNFSNAVLPDMIDPLGGAGIPSSEALASQGKTVFDVGTGFLFIYREFLGGFSLNHLSQPSLSEKSYSDEKLKREVVIHLAYTIRMGKNKDLIIKPVGFFEYQANYLSWSAGAVLENNILSLNALMIKDNVRNTNMQTGFSLKAGLITLFYNYRFNVVSQNSVLPFSLLHQTGLAFSLNNVDKRKATGRISFPKM
jgi:type IX secretion system PorP/SprF family membrane protein